MSYIRLLYRTNLQQSDSRAANHKISIPRAAFGTAQQPHSQKEAAIASRPLSGPKGSLSSLLLLVPVPKHGDTTGQAIFCRIGAQHGIVRRQRHEDMIVTCVSRD